MAIQPDIQRRVLNAKYLLRRAVSLQQERSDLACALSVLVLHDAAEMFMIAVTDHVHVKAPDRFMQFWTDLPKHGHAEPPFRNGMDRLNALRVAFKHKGVMPNTAEVRGLVPVVKAFCEEVAQTYLRIDVSRLSMASLVENAKAQELLRSGEDEFAKGQRAEAFVNVRLAFDELQARVEERSPLVHKPQLPTLRRHGELDWLAKYLEALASGLAQTARAVNVLMLGVDLHRYSYFLRNTPAVVHAVSGKYQVVLNRDFGALPDQVFETCFEFVIDFALQTSQAFDPRKVQ